MNHTILHKRSCAFQWFTWVFIVLLALSSCDPAPPPVPSTEAEATPGKTVTPRPSNTAPASTEAPTDTPTPVPSLDVNRADLQGLTIQFWHAWDGEAGEQIETLVDEFNRQNEWGLLVQPNYVDGYDEMFERVNAGLENGDAPDVVVGYLHQALAWDARQEVVDLAAYAGDPTWGLPEEKADFYPVFWEQDLLDGRRLGVPAQRSGQLLFYNATWARELDFTAAPRTPEEFAEQACAAALTNRQDADPENDGTGGWIISTDYPAVLGWLYAFDAQVVQGRPGSARTSYRFDTPEVEQAFSFLRDMYDDGCAWLSDSALPYGEFAERKALFVVGNVIDIPRQIAMLQEAGGRDRWTVIPFPSPVARSAFTVYGPSFYGLASSPERELASWLVIKWLSAPERQARLVEAAGSLPLRASTLPYLGDYGERYPQWLEAVDELTHTARGEPQLASWRIVRWTLNDAATQLFRFYFTIDQVPELLNFWDSTAAELHRGIGEE
jgi:ABC-type glycerol-3-phosphate transport system substrate-binding protein